MNVDRLPLIGGIVASGADDRIFDSLIVLGPVLVLAIAVAGRSWLTTALAVAYIGAFVGYVVYKGIAY